MVPDFTSTLSIYGVPGGARRALAGELTNPGSELCCAKNLALVRSLTGPRDKPSAYPLYIHPCLTGAVVIVEFEFVVEMNLGQIGTNEFLPVGGELLNHAAIGVWYKPPQCFCHR